MNEQRTPLSPAQARELDAAERVVAARIVHNLLEKQEDLGRERGEKLNEEEAKALADAQARLARPEDGQGGNDAEDKEQPAPGSHSQVAAFPSRDWQLRRDENARIRAENVIRVHPPSLKMRAPLQHAHGRAMEKATLLTNNAHDDGDMSEVLMGSEPQTSKDAGEYIPATAHSPAQINVRKDNRFVLLTTLHEIGHHVEAHLDPADIAEVVAAALKSPSVQYLKASRKDSEAYWTSRSELFARAYAQFVAKTSGDEEAAAKLDKARADPYDGAIHWGREEFEPIEKAIKMALKKKGWL